MDTKEFIAKLQDHLLLTAEDEDFPIDNITGVYWRGDMLRIELATGEQFGLTIEKLQ